METRRVLGSRKAKKHKRGWATKAIQKVNGDGRCGVGKPKNRVNGEGGGAAIATQPEQQLRVPRTLFGQLELSCGPTRWSTPLHGGGALIWAWSVDVLGWASVLAG